MAVTTPVRIREGTIFLNSSDCVIFYVVQSLGAGQSVRRPCGPMDKASVYGTGDCRFASYQGHFCANCSEDPLEWQRSIPD